MLQEFSLPLHQRTNVLIAWLLREHVIGFSSADRIVFGDRANMDLHVIDVNQRRLGIGTECVRQKRRHLFRGVPAQALVLRTECVQRSPEPRTAEGRFQVRQDTHDSAGPPQLSSGRHAVAY